MKDHLVIFDGICNLCNGSVNFLIRRDKAKKLTFATYQSAAGQDVLMQHGLRTPDPLSVVYVKQGVAYVKSKAVVEILRDLGCCRNLLYILTVIPPFMRDAIYHLISKNRYILFGRQKSCMVPAPGISDRFLL